MTILKGKIFPIVLGIAALFVESCAAFFSIYGLSKLFAGATIAVIIMASSLEFAKVVTASFLYRYWERVTAIMKSYMIIAVVVLVCITSMGIYGFMSNAFQSSTVGVEMQTTKLNLFEEELSRFKMEKETVQFEKRELQSNMNTELNGLTIENKTRYYDVTKRQTTVKRYQPLIEAKETQLTTLNSKIQSISQQVSDLKVSMVSSGVDVGPVIYVAKFFHTDIMTVVQYLIFVFIAVFDPLAIALVVASNKAWLELLTEHSKPVIKDSNFRSQIKKRYNQLVTPKQTEIEPPTEQQTQESALPTPPMQMPKVVG